MKIFSCVCGQLLFFEGVTCTRCGRTLAYLPDRGILAAVETDPDGLWRDALKGKRGGRYRACRNGQEYQVCNWAVPEADPEEYCRACRLNQVIPNLSDPEAKVAWHRIEVAKRRLIYTLLELDLPLASKTEDPERGLAFSFLKEDATGANRVFTGHSDGIVTINVAEADDPFREKMRVKLGEAYRTLLGHFRHEIGHYYWDRLVADTRWHEGFRALFGDERADYAEARDRHYANGAPPDWSQRFISAYATMHPWEDWAETWAHYLHMVDTLESARAYDLVLKPKPENGPARSPTLTTRRLDRRNFDDLLTAWVPLTVALNSLNRSMGLADPYPFVLPPPAAEKLRFVHALVAAAPKEALAPAPRPARPATATADQSAR
jgi:hypothetical protein